MPPFGGIIAPGRRPRRPRMPRRAARVGLRASPRHPEAGARPRPCSCRGDARLPRTRLRGSGRPRPCEGLQRTGRVHHGEGAPGEAPLDERPRFGIATSSGAGPVRGVYMCPRVTFACPCCGHMESTSATHALRFTTQNRGLLFRPSGAAQQPGQPPDRTPVRTPRRPTPTSAAAGRQPAPPIRGGPSPADPRGGCRAPLRARPRRVR